MSKLNDELVDAAIAYGDAVKALKRAERDRESILDALRGADGLVAGLDIDMRAKRRALDSVMHRQADDQLLEESFSKKASSAAGVLMQAGAA